MNFMDTKESYFLQKGKDIFIIGLFLLLMARAVGAYSLLPSKIDNVLFSMLALFGAIVLAADFFTRILKNRWTYDPLLLSSWLLCLYPVLSI